jgi:hypothetical protein
MKIYMTNKNLKSLGSVSHDKKVFLQNDVYVPFVWFIYVCFNVSLNTFYRSESLKFEMLTHINIMCY